MPTLEEYVECIRVRYPELTVRDAYFHNTDGQFNEIVFINNTIVFRFPRSAETARKFRAEAELLQKIRPYLSLAVPEPVFQNFDLSPCAHPFIGYWQLPGKPLWRHTLDTIEDELTLNRLAEQLARFLQELHGIRVEHLGLQLPIEDVDGPESWNRLYDDFRTHLFPYMRPDAQDQVTRNFDRFLNSHHRFNYAPTLRHGDFGPSNILHETSSGTITGILDFDSISLGDPAVDAGAVLNLGEEFFNRMCQTYPQLAAMQNRAAFYRSTYALQEALYGLRDNVPESFEAGIADYR